MYSSHPSLSIFYFGDRSGNVCRVDIDGSASLSEGECVLLCKEAPCTDGIGNEGFSSLRVLDDQFVFTATASSTINCWVVVMLELRKEWEAKPDAKPLQHLQRRSRE
jgi:WD repeat-containing protein 48